MNVAERKAQETYRALLGHTETCDACRAGEECDEAVHMSRAWRAWRSAARTGARTAANTSSPSRGPC